MLDYFDCNRIIQNHGIKLPNGQVYLTKPLGVFKKVKTPSKDTRQSVLGGKNVRLIDCSELILDRVKTLAAASDRHYMQSAIANLVLPVGTIVNLAQNNSCKMRASQAICWSISQKGGQDGGVEFAYPMRSSSDLVYQPYVSGRLGSCFSDYERMAKRVRSYNWANHTPKEIMVSPDLPFSSSLEECDSGIHFFLESERAVNY
jgi:hypothetical protein